MTPEPVTAVAKSATLVTDHVAFVNVVEPIEPLMVDVPPLRTYWYICALAPEPTSATIPILATNKCRSPCVNTPNFIESKSPVKLLLRTQLE